VRLATKFGFGLLLFATRTALAWIGPCALRVRHAKAEAARGFAADFHSCVQDLAGHGGPGVPPATILLQPNDSGRTSDAPEVHRGDAWWKCFGRHRIADDLSVVLLVPAFVRSVTDWRIHMHALDRDSLTTGGGDLRRLDLQFLAMVGARGRCSRPRTCSSRSASWSRSCPRAACSRTASWRWTRGA
jgi:hypothetical protein